MANAAHVYQFADAIIAYGDYEAGTVFMSSTKFCHV